MDPISDLLTIVRNGYIARKNKVTVNYSKVKHSLVDIFLKNGYLEGLEVDAKKEVVNKKLILTLRYINSIPAISKITRISKPSVRIYTRSQKIPSSLSGSGITVISTSKGLMTGKNARKENLGGEIICKVY